MDKPLTGFTYGGLSPHKFTPMPGVHKINTADVLPPPLIFAVTPFQSVILNGAIFQNHLVVDAIRTFQYPPILKNVPINPITYY